MLCKSESRLKDRKYYTTSNRRNLSQTIGYLGKGRAENPNTETIQTLSSVGSWRNQRPGLSNGN